MNRVLQIVPALLLAVVFGVFSALSPQFAEWRNVSNILVQSSSLAILATGMTFVLITAGIDLSVGSIMFVCAAVAGKIIAGGGSLAAAVPAILCAGLAFGLVNGALISQLGILPFIVTLASLYAGRGLALYITETRAMNLPEEIVRLGTGSLLGVPVPVWIMGAVLGCASLVLSRTQFGRQIYATGNNPEGARNAGVNVTRLLLAVYSISGVCAAIAGLVSVAQLGAVSPTFGNQREFAAIAAAVLGGTSLFGGRGTVIPGTLAGAVLIQTVESGLVIVNADPYLYPMILAGIIFLAVLVDGIRSSQMEKLRRRTIRPITA